MVKTIYVLNGPNLDLLGTREPGAHGDAALGDVEKLCGETAGRYGLHAECRRSDREDKLIDLIHQAHTGKAAGIIINAGGYFHTSTGLHDVLAAVKIPAVEVQVGNIRARENFRHQRLSTTAAFASLCGFGIDGYRLAISGLAARIGAETDTKSAA